MNEVVVVNENDEVIGTMSKDDAHKNATPHRIAVVYVENQSGQFLVQVRVDGTLDHSAAGHVHPGESYLEAAKRELAEELGITDVIRKHIGHGRTTGEIYGSTKVSHVFDIFSCIASPGILQADEVRDVYWAQPEEILADMEKDDDSSKYCGGFKVSLPVYINSRSS